ncbi:hypothetical protein [Streptomyces litmocidini]|uniref:Uncharacterized protein n=1 Tax=Streptomyces litmocidini TaxID=67318 RepID=A0ABW7U5T3_9ACTN
MSWTPTTCSPTSPGRSGSAQLGIARPSLTTSLADTQALLARYNGTGPDAQKYGQELIGLYQVLENYNALSRV